MPSASAPPPPAYDVCTPDQWDTWYAAIGVLGDGGLDFGLLETVGLETGRRLRGTRAGRETVGLDGGRAGVQGVHGRRSLGRTTVYVGIGNTLKISYDYV